MILEAWVGCSDGPKEQTDDPGEIEICCMASLDVMVGDRQDMVDHAVQRDADHDLDSREEPRSLADDSCWVPSVSGSSGG